MIGGPPIPMYSQPYAMPYGVSPYTVPYAAVPQPNYAPVPPYAGQFAPAPGPRPAAPPPSMIVGNGWQSGPPPNMPPMLAVQAPGNPHPKLRGSIPDARPKAPPAPTPIRLPSPTELGLAPQTLQTPALSLPSPAALGLMPPLSAGNR
jgi:hypothetical protein